MIIFIKRQPIGLAFLCVLLGLIFYRILTADPIGYCSTEHNNSVKNQFLSDEYFIKIALRDGYSGKISKFSMLGNVTSIEEKENLITKFIVEYPECCKVYRKSEGGAQVYNTLWDRAFWRFQTIVVEVWDIDSLDAMRRGENPTHDVALLPISICGKYL